MVEFSVVSGIAVLKLPEICKLLTLLYFIDFLSQSMDFIIVSNLNLKALLNNMNCRFSSN